jgi:hypothetical protein
MGQHTNPFLVRDVSKIGFYQHSANGRHNVETFTVQYGTSSDGPWYNVTDDVFTALCYTPIFQESVFSIPYTAPFWRLLVLSTCSSTDPNATAPQILDMQLYAQGNWVADPSWIQSASDVNVGLLDGDTSTFWQPGPDPANWVVTLAVGSFDSLIVLETCGVTSGFMQKFSHGGFSVEQQTGPSGITQPAPQTATSASWFTISWGSVVVSTSGGIYRLCWCSRNFVCSSSEDFRVDVGQLDVLGPRVSEHTCVAGQLCTFEGIIGRGLSPGDSVLPLDTCGTTSPLTTPYGLAPFLNGSSPGSIARWGSAALTLAGGEYRMCWCSGLQLGCSIVEDFRVDAGKLVVIGPAPLIQDRT